MPFSYPCSASTGSCSPAGHRDRRRRVGSAGRRDRRRGLEGGDHGLEDDKGPLLCVSVVEQERSARTTNTGVVPVPGTWAGQPEAAGEGIRRAGGPVDCTSASVSRPRTSEFTYIVSLRGGRSSIGLWRLRRVTVAVLVGRWGRMRLLVVGLARIATVVGLLLLMHRWSEERTRCVSERWMARAADTTRKKARTGTVAGSRRSWEAEAVAEDSQSLLGRVDSRT